MDGINIGKNLVKGGQKEKKCKKPGKTEKSLCPKFTNRCPAKMEKSFYICVQTLKNVKKNDMSKKFIKALLKY